MSEEDPTPDELREAEALARALEGQPGEAAAPPEALEAAAFLRHGGGELDPNHAAALAARLRAEIQPRRRTWLWWLAPLVAGATAVALCVPARRHELPSLTSLPSPPPALLAAQAQVARGQGRAIDDLDGQMRAYRKEMFRRLREAR
jgi:hypothetical protein